MISLPSSTEGGGEFQGWSGPELLPCRAILLHVNDVVDVFWRLVFFHVTVGADRYHRDLVA
jgi:hypothetical protein